MLINKNIALQNKIEALEIKNILAECENNKSLRRLRHDVINQNFTVDMLLQKGDIASAREFIGGGQSRLEGIIPNNFCANYIINGILIYENRKCKDLGFDLDITANVSQSDLKCSDEELCIIFNTLFELAIKNTSDKKIKLDCKKINSALCIFLSFNSKSKSLKLKNIKSIAEKHNGKVNASNKDGKAEIKIFI